MTFFSQNNFFSIFLQSLVLSHRTVHKFAVFRQNIIMHFESNAPQGHIQESILF